jgi:hypothetical protein
MVDEQISETQEDTVFTVFACRQLPQFSLNNFRQANSHSIGPLLLLLKLNHLTLLIFDYRGARGIFLTSRWIASWLIRYASAYSSRPEIQH